jgi:hypothetical protein
MHPTATPTSTTIGMQSSGWRAKGAASSSAISRTSRSVVRAQRHHCTSTPASGLPESGQGSIAANCVPSATIDRIAGASSERSRRLAGRSPTRSISTRVGRHCPWPYARRWDQFRKIGKSVFPASRQVCARVREWVQVGSSDGRCPGSTRPDSLTTATLVFGTVLRSECRQRHSSARSDRPGAGMSRWRQSGGSVHGKARSACRMGVHGRWHFW